MNKDEILGRLKGQMPDLHDYESEGIELSFTSKDYGEVDQIVNHLQNHTKTQNVPSESLRIDGDAVQNAMDKYLEDDRFGSSVLKAAFKSELHLEFAKGEDKALLESLKDQKDYFNLGEYLHQCILEPTKFGRAIVEPNCPLNTNDGCDKAIKWWEQTARSLVIMDIEDDRRIALGTLISEADTSKITGKRQHIQDLKDFCDLTPVSEINKTKIDILKKHYENYQVSEFAPKGLIERLLRHSKREISMFYDKYKIRPDALQFEENIGVNAVISVKSTAQSDLRGYFAQQAKLHYDLTEAMYLDIASKITGRNFNTCINIMLQTTEPYGVAVIVWTPEDLETGHYKYQYAKTILERCEETGIYRSYDMFAEEGHMGMIQSKLPTWNQNVLLEVSDALERDLELVAN